MQKIDELHAYQALVIESEPQIYRDQSHQKVKYRFPEELGHNMTHKQDPHTFI
jgi:hypothetical protein